MKRFLFALLAAVALVDTANASVHNYACRVKDEATGIFNFYSLKIDTVIRTIMWRGSTFKNLKEGNVGEDCAKYCFKAIRSNGDVAFIRTATQGAANLLITYNRPGEAAIDEFDCDMVRDK